MNKETFLLQKCNLFIQNEVQTFNQMKFIFCVSVVYTLQFPILMKFLCNFFIIKLRE